MVLDSRQHCNSSLVILACDAVEAFNRHSLSHDMALSHQCEQFRREIALQIFFDEKFVD